MYQRLSGRIGSLTAVVALIAAVLLSEARTAQAEAVPAPGDGYGFSVGAPMTWMSRTEADGELDAAARTGATWLRVFIDWSRVEPMPGAYNWGYVDHWIDGALSRGIKVLASIGYSPDWARAPETYFTGPPVEPAVFASFVTTVAQRYGDRVTDWEIWNEPNIPLFWGYRGNRAVEYTALLKAAYPAIKAVQPHSTVIAGGLSPAFAPDAPPTFVSEMYANGAKGFFDAMAMHPYVFPHGLAADALNGWSDVERVHRIMTDNGDGEKKIWMTEMGAPTSARSAEGVSQQEQAQQILDGLRKAAETSYSGPAFIFCIRDTNTANQDNREDNFGVLTTDWQPKVAATVLAG
ncbi:cellulase family glycosylhydrolase [Mycobacterium sp. B14F4]|uniref:cellulase family glycosylhydrolase n=1 Tax=Mycobacterium sp. B14F4 TaxID=3153565 RepID=UPI00325F096E